MLCLYTVYQARFNHSPWDLISDWTDYDESDRTLRSPGSNG
jgi:hypothetical protein